MNTKKIVILSEFVSSRSKSLQISLYTIVDPFAQKRKSSLRRACTRWLSGQVTARDPHYDHR